MMGHKGGAHMVSFWLLVIGGLNWLVLALFDWDVSALVGGMDSMGAKIIYVVVGLAAVYEAFTHGGRCKECKGDEMMDGKPGAM